MEKKAQLIRSTETTSTIVGALNVVGWLCVIAGFVLGAKGLSYSLLTAAYGVASGFGSALGLFAFAALLNHVRQLVLLQAGERPNDN